MSDFVTVAKLSDFGDNNALRVQIHGEDIAVFRQGDRIYALNDRCPHKGGPLSLGWVEDGHVFCPLHAWKFDLQTGSCESNWERPAQSYEVKIVNNEVQIRQRGEPSNA